MRFLAIILYSSATGFCFHHFWRGLLCLFVASCCFSCLDEDCNPGWGDCGRPLRLLLFVLLKMVNGYVLFIGDWTIRSNSAWSKKNSSLLDLVFFSSEGCECDRAGNNLYVVARMVGSCHVGRPSA